MSVAHTRTGKRLLLGEQCSDGSQKKLTQLVHGPDGLKTAQQATAAFFGAGNRQTSPTKH